MPTFTKPEQLQNHDAYKPLLKTALKTAASGPKKFLYYRQHKFGGKALEMVLVDFDPALPAKLGSATAEGKVSVNDANQLVFKAEKGKVKLTGLKRYLGTFYRDREVWVPADEASEGVERESETASTDAEVPLPGPQSPAPPPLRPVVSSAPPQRPPPPLPGPQPTLATAPVSPPPPTRPTAPSAPPQRPPPPSSPPPKLASAIAPPTPTPTAPPQRPPPTPTARTLPTPPPSPTASIITPPPPKTATAPTPPQRPPPPTTPPPPVPRATAPPPPKTGTAATLPQRPLPPTTPPPVTQPSPPPPKTGTAPTLPQRPPPPTTPPPTTPPVTRPTPPPQAQAQTSPPVQKPDDTKAKDATAEVKKKQEQRAAKEAAFKQKQAKEQATSFSRISQPIKLTRRDGLPKGDADKKAKEVAKLSTGIEKGASARLAKGPDLSTAEKAAIAEREKVLKEAQVELKKVKGDRSKLKAKQRAAVNNADTREAFNKQTKDLLSSVKKLEGGKPNAKQLAELEAQCEALVKDTSDSLQSTRQLVMDEHADSHGRIGAEGQKRLDSVADIRSQNETARSVLLEIKMRDVSLDPVLDAMRNSETDKSKANLEALVSACTAFLALLDSAKFFDVPRSPALQRKENIARSALKDARIMLAGAEYDQLGPPPWDDEKQTKADELYARMDFEENTEKQRARYEKSTACGTWFVERMTGARDKKGKKVYDAGGRGDSCIFKPLDTEVSDEIGTGWKQGGGGPREVMAKTVSDTLERATGLNLGVCGTSLVALDTEHLPDAEGNFSGKPGSKRLGALQHMEECKDTIGGWFQPSFPAKGTVPDDEWDRLQAEAEKLGKERKAKLPPEDYGTIALFDMMTMQMDRHAGNILVQEDHEGKTRMVPIDHGLSMPTREAFESSSARMGPPQNVLATLPHKDQPLDAKVLAALDAIDPDEIEAEMKKSRDLMKKTHPETSGSFGTDKDPDESIRIVKRSTIFLKRAAPKLTVAELFSVYSGDAAKKQSSEFLKVIDAKSDTDAEKVINEIIAAKIAARPPKK